MNSRFSGRAQAPGKPRRFICDRRLVRQLPDCALPIKICCATYRSVEEPPHEP